MEIILLLVLVFGSFVGGVLVSHVVLGALHSAISDVKHEVSSVKAHLEAAKKAL